MREGERKKLETRRQITMIDTTSIDLLRLIGQDVALKRTGSTHGGEYHGPCPGCGGKDRFMVWPDHPRGSRYYCRGCGKSGDAIQYLTDFHGMTCKEALEALGLNKDALLKQSDRSTTRPLSLKTASISPTSALTPIKWDTPALCDPEWQAGAAALCLEGVDRLWSAQGRAARVYLLGRGLTEAVIRQAGLGYFPSRYEQRSWGRTTVQLRAGILIPWSIGGRYWQVKMRRLPGPLRASDSKYMQAAGGAGGLYLNDDFKLGDTLVITEGEFDALAVRSGLASAFQEQHHVAVVATGSTCGARNMLWLTQIALARKVILAFDADEAGEAAATWWLQQLGTPAVRWCPTAHDVNEMLSLDLSLEEWLLPVLTG